VRILGLIVALWLSALLPTNSLALGLGEIEVNSFLNQPLNAEIQVISARPGEIDDLLVSLASREAFTRAGLARTRNLSELRFAVKKNEEGDQAVILVTTRSAVKEPFLNFLIEADWSKGRVLREFTVLLDPPFYANQPAAVETASQPVEQPATEEASVTDIVEQSGVTPIAESSVPVETNETITEPIAMAEDTQPEDTQPEDTQPEDTQPEPVIEQSVTTQTQNIIEDDVLVVKGDTLWSIASAHKDQGHSMAQVMLAFQRANPEAFNDGNINNMNVGAVLRTPSVDELDAIGQQEAYAEVLVQNGLWDEYVARVTGVSPAVASEDGGAEVAVQEAGTDAGGELSLLVPGEGESESTGTGDTGEVDTLRTRLAISEEELDASRIENQELESRIAELQARLSKVEELQKMVEIEDDSLAQIQADQTESAEAMEQVEEQAGSEPVNDAIEANEEDLLEELLAEEAAAQADELIDTDDSTVEATGADGMMTEEAETGSTVPVPVIVTESVTRASSIFDGILPPDIIDMIPSMDGILGDPIILVTIGGVVVLLLFLVVLKRRKSSADEESGISDSGDGSLFTEVEEDEFTPIHLPDGVEPDETDINIPGDDDAVVAESADQSEDDVAVTEIISEGDTPESETPAPATAAEQDDVLNEVDVYLAYGLYDNAEDLLNGSLTETPDRADYRSKLLDTYFATKKVEAFCQEADKLKSMGDAAGDYWDRVQIMGYELAPDNPLFSDAKDSGLSASDLEISKPQEADFDLGVSDDDDTSFSATDFNLGEDDTGGDYPGDDYTDTSKLGEAGEISVTQQIPDADEFPELDAEVDTAMPAEVEPDTALELPDDVGDELEFSIDDEVSSSESEETDGTYVESTEVGSFDDLELDSPAADEADDAEIDEMAMEFDIAEDEAAAAGDGSDFTDTAVLPDTDDDGGVDADDVIDLGSDDTALATAGLDLETQELSLVVDDANEDISIIDFGGEDFIEPGDVVDSNDELADSTDMASESIRTGTFAPGDFEEPAAAADSMSDIDDIDDLMLPDDVDEVSTKLDLARAFIDMGDTEGARGSLEEVMVEGNDEQKAEAKALLEQT
jgi:pilus assembly protein FimV